MGVHAMNLTLNLDLGLSTAPTPAAMPAEHRGLRRDEVRMLVISRKTGELQHVHFYELPNFLTAGDVLVVNASATIPGRLHAKYHGQPFFVHLATRLSAADYIVERRTASGGPDEQTFGQGDSIQIMDPKTGFVAANLVVESRFHPNSRLWKVHSDADLFELANHIGNPIRYSYVPRDYSSQEYQTVFARFPGSAEMPSAGRPFTKDVLRNLARKGVQIRSLVLHTGVSSHEVETDLAHYPILPEWYSIPWSTASAVNQALDEGRRIIAVGTTVVRALESAVNAHGRVESGWNWTTHLVTPDTPPRIVTSLVTGMHDSQTSHLAMMYTFVKPTDLRHAYQEAMRQGYLWHEFGDTSLML